MTTFTCSKCQKQFETDQTHVRQWPIQKWWNMVGKQCVNCRVQSQGEPRQSGNVANIPTPRQPADDQIQDAAGGVNTIRISNLAAARHFLMQERENGIICPTCDQFAKVYQRKLNSSMCLSLITMYKAGGTSEYLHTPSLLGGQRGEEARLSYWGLTQEFSEKREDGGRRGWWRVTRRGELFIQQAISVPSHARIYNSQCLGLVGESVSIKDALGSKFDLRELMGD